MMGSVQRSVVLDFDGTVTKPDLPGATSHSEDSLIALGSSTWCSCKSVLVLFGL
jgi:hypothetical protein